MLSKVFIGYDKREEDAYNVCKFSLKKSIGNFPLDIVSLKQDVLRATGIYTRDWHYDSNGQQIDNIDGRPFSTEFAFTRFLVPFLSQKGWALSIDNDMLFRDNVLNLIGHLDNKYAVMVVKHDYQPTETFKMGGKKVGPNYNRKNWSSFILWNLDHPANKKLTIGDVNKRSGRWLHSFSWLKDSEIGELPVTWNWLAGWNTEADPKVVHYTKGLPTISGYENSPYADEWFDMLRQYRALKERQE